MQMGLVGLGRMGAGIRERLRQAGHDIVGYDRDPKVTDTPSLAALVDNLAAPRVVWVMVPAGGPTAAVIAELATLLAPGDLVVDGGNSKFTDSQSRAQMLAKDEIGFCDVGVSGGIWGLTEGFGLMAGGALDDIARLQPIFDAMAPEGGFVHAGPVGSGHFTKMVHNGVEYGMMQAYAEGYELLSASPLHINVAASLEAWRHGTVVRSWLLDLFVKAIAEHPGLTDVAAWADDSGEGRWTVEQAIELAVPAPVITAALFARFGSRAEHGNLSMKAIAALRQQFGGHPLHTMSGEVTPPTGPGGPVPSHAQSAPASEVAKLDDSGSASSAPGS